MILNFSATGNSLVIARQLAQALPEMELVPFRALEGQSIEVSGCVGLVFPVHAWGPPSLVKETLSRIRFAPNTYVFAVATYGTLAAGTLAMLEPMIARQGGLLSLGRTVQMPEVFVPVFSIPAETTRQAQYKTAAATVSEIAQQVRSRVSGEVDRGFFLWRWLFSLIAYRLSEPNFRRLGARFAITEDCTRCGKCSDLCPTHNITKGEEGALPCWGGRCTFCLTCLHWCPAHAISFGPLSRGHGQYHHPEVKSDDL